MDTIQASSHLQTTSARRTGNSPLVPIAGKRQSSLGAAAAVKSPVKRRSPVISEDQIRQALKKFEKRGGLIRKLPPQVAPTRVSVGPQHAQFDYLLEAVGLNFI